MPFVETNGVRLSYATAGAGEPVLLIMGTGASGHAWTMHQTPALHRAGYRTIVFDNRGVPPSDAPDGKYSMADLMADTAGLIEALDLAPCRIVGTSLGAMVAQELAVAAPGLVRCAVLLATRARTDVTRSALAAAERSLSEGGVRLPPVYAAAVAAQQMFSPATLNADVDAATWLELFELTGGGLGAGGQAWVETGQDRRAALAAVTAPCRVIAFADDLITPPHLAREVAEAIPDCDYVELADCGHLGHLEQPDAVNAAIVDFLDAH
ncbi:alpha/beta fold hydrolase [Streptomyces sp. NPDC005574]|uniref:alpha/beta fold hydrolase n=1 Tax=Streptomyces sp. NPDC005574 TaxID=3156891 RepID=UPI0033A96F5E